MDISIAIKTALTVALYDCFDGFLTPSNGQFMAKVDHCNGTIFFFSSMEPSVKFVLAIIDSISKKEGVMF